VCNVLVADETGEATLVLWNDDVDFAERKLERDSCVRAESVLVKKPQIPQASEGVELHSTLFTALVLESPPLNLPAFSKPAKKLAEVGEGDDFFARVAAKGRMTEFGRNGEERFVLNLTVEDETAQKTLVCWNRNAQIANFLKEGDVLKAEGITLKNGELHASWQTHLIPHAKNHPLKELEFKPLSSLADGERAFVQVVLQKLFEARVSRKCVSCGLKVSAEKEKCSCGGIPKKVFFVTAEVADAFDFTQRARCVFFEEQAKELLGMKQTLVSPETIFSLKKDFLEGKTLKAKAFAKRMQDGRVELIVKQIRSR